jgi:hypothetical protein
MPIVILVVSTLTLWVIYWFVRMGGVDHFRDASAKRKEEARRTKARKSERTAPLRAIDDPRDAALVLMLLIPRGSDPTRAQFSAIEETMRVVFGFETDLIERLTQARFIASCAESFDEAAGLFSDLFNKRLTAGERRELVAMVEQIARIDGPSAGQTTALDVLQRRIGLATAQGE